MLYSSHAYGPFEKFARSISKSYFDRFRITLAVETADDLRNLCASITESRDHIPKWEFDSINPLTLAAAGELSTVP